MSGLKRLLVADRLRMLSISHCYSGRLIMGQTHMLHKRNLVCATRLPRLVTFDPIGRCMHGAERESNLRITQTTCLKRLMASSATSVVSNATPVLPPGYIPEPPSPLSVPGDAVEELVTQLNALGEPALQSLGLATWWPWGLVQSMLEQIHVGLNVPWWASIVIGTFIIRLVTFPLFLMAQKNAAKMHNYMPVFQKMQAKFTAAQQANNHLAVARAGVEMRDYMQKHKINPLTQTLVPLAPLPIFLSVFIGIRQMANLPVESMVTGGIGWFTDLTVPDPYYLLPVITSLTFLATLELGVDGVRAASMSVGMRRFMRALPFVMFPFIINFPTGLCMYWVTSNIYSFALVMCMKIPGAKEYFGIPPMVQHDPEDIKQMKKPVLKSLRETWKGAKTVVTVEDMLRTDATKFKEAGMVAIPKTYSYDPTKVAKSETKDGKLNK